MTSTNIKSKNALSSFLQLIVLIASFITFTALIMIIGYILIKGIPNLSSDLFSINYTSDNASLLPSFINTLIITLLSLLIAVPLGIFTAIYLVEYAGSDNAFVRIVRLTTETLSGIPSIIYGLFGMMFFVMRLNLQFSLLSGALTLSIMILPLIIRTTEEALKSVPVSSREASFGLGAGKLRTIFKIVLPASSPGIFAGVILSIGRIVGETAALIFTAGTVAKIPKSLLSSGRTLAVHMYALSGEGLYTDQAYATAAVLLLLVLIINTLSAFLVRRLTK